MLGPWHRAGLQGLRPPLKLTIIRPRAPTRLNSFDYLMFIRNQHSPDVDRVCTGGGVLDYCTIQEQTMLYTEQNKETGKYHV